MVKRYELTVQFNNKAAFLKLAKQVFENPSLRTGRPAGMSLTGHRALVKAGIVEVE